MSKRKGVRVQPWSPIDIELLTSLYPVHGIEHTAMVLRRSRFAVKCAAQKLRLKSQNRARFKPGQKPWNAGRKIESRGRSAETQFRKGARPHTWQPIGHEVLRCGVWWRKVTDEGHHTKHYKSVPRMLWEAQHGPIPSGHVVVMRAAVGSAAEITLDHIELISRTELIRRNSIHRYPEELRACMVLAGRVRAAIKRREEGAS